MIEKRYRINLFELGYLLIIVSSIISLSTFNHRTIIIPLSLCGYLLLSLHFIKRPISRNFLLPYVLIGVFVFISYIKSNDDLLLIIYLLGLSFNGIDIKDLVKKDLFVRIIVVGSIMLFGYLGFIPNITNTGVYGAKVSLGFSHPNHLGSMMFVISIYYLFIKHKHFKLRDFSVLGVCFIIANYVSKSRTSSLMIFVLIVFEVLDKCLSFYGKSEKIKDMIVKIGKYLIWVVPFGSIYLAYNYDESNLLLTSLNRLMTGRLYLAYHAALNNQLTLFGKYIEYLGGKNSTVAVEFSNAIDNSYVYILLHLGVIVFILFIVGLWGILNYLAREKNRIAFMCVIFFMIAGFSESTMFQILSNIFMLYIIPVLKFRRKWIP